MNYRKLLIFHLLFIQVTIESHSDLNNIDFETAFNQANTFFQQYNHDEAIRYYTHAIELNNTCAQAYFNRGIVFLDKDNHDNAINDFEMALKYNPHYTKAHIHLGKALETKQRFETATEHFQKAIELEPTSCNALLSLARTLFEQEHYDEAEKHLENVLEIEPNNLEALLGLGNIFSINQQFEKALGNYQKMLELLPEESSIRYNIAYTLKRLGHIEKSIAMYNSVIEKKPDYAEAHFGLGLAYLVSENFELGWQEYEWRWKRTSSKPRNLSKPQWDGSDICGKTIVIHAEQGLGDTFQFIRYARVLKEQGATVIAAVQDQLIPLLSFCPYIDIVLSLWSQFPPYDVHAPLMTLPLIMKTTIDTIPSADTPYLFAKQKLIEHWHKQLENNTDFKIGICWQGNKSYQSRFLKAAVAAKSIHLSLFEPIASIPGVTMYSLQQINGTEQLKELHSFSIVTFDKHFDKDNGRFMDTAALMKNLDLIITIDTSIAHLAGGLGVPVWLLLPNPPDWRWLLNRLDTPWYSTVHLFRQPVTGDWESVMEDVLSALRNLLNQKNN